MKILSARSCTVLYMGMLAIFTVVGCSSKQEEIAIAPTAPAPAAPQADYDSTSGDDMSSEDDGSDDSDDYQTGDDDSGSDDSSMEDDSANEDDSMAESDDSMDDSMDDSDGSQVAMARAKPKNLREQADQAFNDGLEKAAYRLMQAHLLASSEDASELLAHYRWSPSRKQPQLGARIAVGVVLDAPSDIKDYKPVGSLAGFFSNRKSSSRSRFPGAEDGNAGVAPISVKLQGVNNQERILQKYAGLMGDVLVDHVKELHAQGLFSPAFQELKGVAATAAIQFGGDGSDDGSGGSEDSEEMMPPNLMRAELDTKIEGEEAKYISVGPALAFIGTGSAAELVEFAKRGEFDGLVIFDVEITLNLKLRMIYNECRAKFIGLSDGKPVAVSKLLKNTESQKEIDKSGISFVVSAMQPVLTKLDEAVALKEIPSVLTSEIIKTKRLPVLLSSTARSKLETLAEIRLYREKGLLEEADVNAAFETILGAEEGLLLANGTDEERLTIVKKLLAAAPSP